MEDIIEVIPQSMEKFFGCSGEMVKPSADTVRKLVLNISEGEVATLEQLRDKLAKDFGVQSACPASTTKALTILSKETSPVCYWRIIKNNGELIAKYPNGIEGHASLLESEGVKIDYSKKNPIVAEYKTKLFSFI